MPVRLTALSDIARLGFDAVIDARTPAEFADDHLPGAISLPVLNNDERARVGTIYKQVEPFAARKVGGALVARNVAQHLETALSGMPGGWRPLVYCWRGGQRSGSFATILAQVGWRAETIEGGYKAWRGIVLERLLKPVQQKILLLDGNTGSGKTLLLAALAARGVQVLDLEALAGHRGSLFGSLGAQPSQRMFEGRLAHAIDALDPARPVVIEAESAKIGDCRLPGSLLQAMQRAPRVELVVPLAARAAHLAGSYPEITTDAPRLCATLDRLKLLHSAERVAAWKGLAAGGHYAELAQELMLRHYDPRYARHRARSEVPGQQLEMAGLSPEDLNSAAAHICAMLEKEI